MTAIAVTPPNFVELEVMETDPGLKGDSDGGTKPATLSTGFTVKSVPVVNIGDIPKLIREPESMSAELKAEKMLLILAEISRSKLLI